MKMKRKEVSRKSFILRLCIVAFVAYAALLLVDMQVNLSEHKRNLEVLDEHLEVQRLENKELERRLSQDVNEEYIERMAREMEFVAPDERVFIDISGN